MVDGICALTDPYQRAASLIARWVGPRRSEIRRLELDCIDAYPHGHPRLGIPAGKTYIERIVPLHPEAADALLVCIEQTRARRQRPLVDTVTGKPTSYVFQLRGRLFSDYFLFDSPLHQACTHAGLLDTTGAKTITTHRFRHTVGTQLAEEGARLQTIMAILGHTSPAMSLFYARITDTAVRRDYQAALQPGAHLAGAAAEAIRNDELSEQAVEMAGQQLLQDRPRTRPLPTPTRRRPLRMRPLPNLLQVLQHCRVCTRLRERLCLEQRLAADAAQRGWPREVERQTATARRVEDLLNELDYPVVDPTTDGASSVGTPDCCGR